MFLGYKNFIPRWEIQVLVESLLILCVIAVLLLCSLFISFPHKSAALLPFSQRLSTKLIYLPLHPLFLLACKLEKNPQLSEIAVIEV